MLTMPPTTTPTRIEAVDKSVYDALAAELAEVKQKLEHTIGLHANQFRSLLENASEISTLRTALAVRDSRRDKALEEAKNLRAVLDTPANEVRVELEGLRTFREQALRDFSTVSEALLNAAQEREWCSEYDEFVDEVNSGTRHFKLTPRSRVRKVTVTVTIEENVEASDDQEAIDLVRDQLESRLAYFDTWNEDDLEVDIAD